MLIAKLVLIAVSLCLVTWLVVRVVRNARRLDERIREYQEEQESGLLTDPYAALSELLSEKDKETPKE
jgi:hypothetical protein